MSKEQENIWMKQIEELRLCWNRMEELFSETNRIWQGEAADSHNIIYDKAVKRPMEQVLEDLTNEKEHFFG